MRRSEIEINPQEVLSNSSKDNERQPIEVAPEVIEAALEI